ncbi:hypothetical protein E4U42_002017, partial [Claviceps africana]
MSPLTMTRPAPTWFNTGNMVHRAVIGQSSFASRWLPMELARGCCELRTAAVSCGQLRDKR